MRLLRCAPAAVFLAASTQAFAQATPADNEVGRQQQEQVQRQQQEQILRDQRVRPAPPKAPGGIDTEALVPKVDATQAAGKCRDISDIEIKGAPNIARTLPLQIQQNFVGRCLGVTEVEQILAEITRSYVLRGYVTTRAYLPAQDLSKGKARNFGRRGPYRQVAY